MGVTYSIASGSQNDRRRQLFQGISEDKARDFVTVFIEHAISPLLDRLDLSFMVRHAIDIPAEDEEFVESLWGTFKTEDQLVHTYELLGALMLTTACPWNRRAELLFDVFKCSGVEEMFYDDISMAVKCSVVGMCRVWNLKYDTADLSKIAEGVAKNAFMKLGKEMEESISKQEYLSWLLSRFEESLCIIDYDTMMKILEAPNRAVSSSNSYDSVSTLNVDIDSPVTAISGSQNTMVHSSSSDEVGKLLEASERSRSRSDHDQPVADEDCNGGAVVEVKDLSEFQEVDSDSISRRASNYDIFDK